MEKQNQKLIKKIQKYQKIRKNQRKKRGLQGVPPETAQKNDFLRKKRRNVTRNREAIEAKKSDFELKKNEKIKQNQKTQIRKETQTLDPGPQGRSPPFRRLTCVIVRGMM